MLCQYVMDFHFSVMEKSWKVIVEKEWAPCFRPMSTVAKWSAILATAELLLLMYCRVIKQCSVLTFAGRIFESALSDNCFCLNEPGAQHSGCLKHILFWICFLGTLGTVGRLQLQECKMLPGEHKNVWSNTKVPSVSGGFALWPQPCWAQTIRRFYQRQGEKCFAYEFVIGQPFAKRFAMCYQTVVCPVLCVCPVCNVGVLWSKGWMDQNEMAWR